ncbi:MAG: outer membrane beta-barrel protein [Flavobacteriia bacterium]|nr:outer membrane beta-barrel protein [Flavobacteriia bacterium]
MNRIFKCLSFFLLALDSFSQIGNDTLDKLFKGTNINPYNLESDSTANWSYSAYIDTYYAFYTDSSNLNSYQKFPTISPKSESFGINILQFGTKYESQRFHGVATLFFGDTPNAAWSPFLNYIQEANIGFRLVKNLWLDMGFFRTHIGLESIQPRENMTLSVSSTSYFEPYFLSGAKLTWIPNKKWTTQINVFNSFNQFIETNKNKAVGFSILYNVNSNWSMTLNSIFCDESSLNYPLPQLRAYFNFYSMYVKKRWSLGFDSNFALQQNSKLNNLKKSAYMWSGVLVSKYRFTPLFAGYFRTEVYSDPDEMLTGPIEDENHTLVGLDILGFTHGYEYKPIPNAYFRIETRYLQTKKDERIFFYNNQSNNFRWEFLLGMGLWF